MLLISPSGHDVRVVWTSLESVLDTLRVERHEELDLEVIELAVDAFAICVINGLVDFRTISIPTGPNRHGFEGAHTTPGQVAGRG